MAERCMDCRKLEEDMYWSRFQAVQFCLVLLSGFLKQLALPIKFTKNLREKLSGTVSLQGPSRHTWDVELASDGDSSFLKDGWGTFVEDHCLVENDILIFKYNGNSRFDVAVFDGETSCEKEAAYFVKKCQHTKSVIHNQQRTMEISSDDSSESSDDVDVYHPPKKSKSIGARAPYSREQQDRATPSGRRRSTSKRPRVPYPFKLKSRRRPLQEGEKERAKQLAIAAKTENSFHVIMRATHVYSGFFMTIPAAWARKHMCLQSIDVEFRTYGNSWHAKYEVRGRGQGFGAGWRQFVRETFLEEFDVCVFDCVSASYDSVVFDVQIFRVVQEVIPPRRVSKPRPVRKLASYGRPTTSDEEDED